MRYERRDGGDTVNDMSTIEEIASEVYFTDQDEVDLMRRID